MWKAVGKEGLAVKAPWPKTEEEDKLLTRQAKFLRDSLKDFRAKQGKAKKGATKASIVVTSNYPEWKVNALLWMHEQYSTETNSFAATIMKDLKGWAPKNVPEKSMVKLVMQFVSFVKKEVEDVGPAAMETTLPFDQTEIMSGSMAYIKRQLGLEEIDIINLDDAEAAKTVQDKIQENTNPGKPYLWIR